jgi:hypothetical protein
MQDDSVAAFVVYWRDDPANVTVVDFLLEADDAYRGAD